MTASVRAYRALLRLFLPAGFTDAFAAELTSVFAELDRETRARRGPLLGAFASWMGLVAELPGILRLAISERRTVRTVRAHSATARLEENMFDSLAQDLGFAFRALRRAPGFASIAIVTLALGIGANTAIFSVINGVLLNPLALHDPDRVVAVSEVSRNSGPNDFGETSPGSFADWKRMTRTMELAGFMTSTDITLTGMGEPQSLAGTVSIGGLMQVLGVQPLFGRLITAADEDPALPGVVDLSYEGWQRLFGGDRSVLGKKLTLRGVNVTIVGVMPHGVTYPGSPNDFYEAWRGDAALRANRDQYMVGVLGRLHAGATIEQVRAEMASVSERMKRDWPMYNQANRIVVLPLQQTVVGDIRPQLMVLMGAVAFVLLITCANIGNLLLTRASARRREIAVRQALGAGRSRIVRQLLTESVVLATAGGAVGLLVGNVFLKLLLAAQVTTNLPRAEEIALDGRVLLFTLGISVVAGLFFGTIPAWQLARNPSADALREGSKGSARNQWMRHALVVAELALAMVLLTGAGLLLRSFDLMSRVDAGVKTDHVLTFTVGRRPSDPAFVATSLARLRALPGVRSVAITSSLPITGRGNGAWFNRIDRPLPDNVQPTGEAWRIVTPDYFATVGIRLAAGRLPTEADRRETPAIVVNEALVKKYYPNENPLGKPAYLGAPDNRFFPSAPIVGVVGDTHDAGLGVAPLPTVYIPYGVFPGGMSYTYVLKTTSDPASVVSSARDVIHELDPTLPIRRVRTFDDVLTAAVAPSRWSATLLGTFAGVALVIAVLGVFGVLSYLVAQRTRELGIRIALGASTMAVQRFIMARGMLLVGFGVAIGIVGATALTRFMTSLLYGVTPTDPLTLGGVAALLVGAAGLATYIPARRATRVDPMVALRAE
jgi:putative ABC transport system permease protein